jgi:hypothetical protein
MPNNKFQKFIKKLFKIENEFIVAKVTSLSEDEQKEIERRWGKHFKIQEQPVHQELYQ